MPKRRLNGLAGSPEQHAVEAKKAGKAASDQAKRAGRAATRKSCGLALMKLNSAYEDVGWARAHGFEAGMKYKDIVEPYREDIGYATEMFNTMCLGIRRNYNGLAGKTRRKKKRDGSR